MKDKDVSPLAWSDLDDEVLLIMERPENCMNLFEYDNGQIDEGLAKEFMRQLVEAAIQIHEAGVFHGDLKLENILNQFYDAWRIPRVRIIDFGCGCFVTLGYRSYAAQMGQHGDHVVDLGLVINPNLRSKAALKMRAVVMSTPFHIPLNRAGDVNVSVAKIMVQALARPDPTLPGVAAELGMRLMAQMMAQKSQQQDQALRDNLIKDVECAGGQLHLCQT
ncbi:hypothetical protein D4764_04G0014610 [Takifugu flavidus]|uniref:non-specific serine/threonine protein kinase n=1 Tax=Takifugu flavidus TaxID=433684 RepID=A0A5C6N5R7_9TELE|nr:hypothetical protein D4764_04G0014610 [Takifugu flavidus]